MTKKNFIALADHLKGVKLSEEALKALCSFCKSQNPAFNETRWREYLAGNCGPNGGEVKPRKFIAGQMFSGT